VIAKSGKLTHFHSTANVALRDEKGIHKLLSVFLALNKQHTFSLHTALHGKAGVEMYSNLVDESKMDYDPKANIYLFTAYAGTEVEKNARNAGAKGTLSKDADWNMTAEKIEDILESS